MPDTVIFLWFHTYLYDILIAYNAYNFEEKFQVSIIEFQVSKLINLLNLKIQSSKIKDQSLNWKIPFIQFIQFQISNLSKKLQSSKFKF